MFKEIKLIVYNSKEHKLRGSFISLCSTILLYISFIIFMSLIFYRVTQGDKLADLTTLILGMFSAMTTSITIIFSIWKTNNTKSKELANGSSQKNKGSQD